MLLGDDNVDLFVCGNGFDKYHTKGKTDYSCFRKWLITKYNINQDEEYYELPTYDTNYKGFEQYNRGEFARLFRTLIDDAERCKYSNDKNHIIEWNIFEELLGEIDWKKIETGAVDAYDSEGDFNPFYTSENYAAAANGLRESCHIIKVFFKNWIYQLDLSDVTPKTEISNFFNNNQLIFLNFNYTDILERVYGIKNVNHIHGYAPNFTELIVGHGNDAMNNDSLNFNEDPVKDEYYAILRDCHESYRKDASTIIERNDVFFQKLVNVKNIYFYGFGFGSADRDYLAELIKRSNTNVSIYICKYQYENELTRIKKELVSSGYKKQVFSMNI